MNKAMYKTAQIHNYYSVERSQVRLNNVHVESFNYRCKLHFKYCSLQIPQVGMLLL